MKDIKADSTELAWVARARGDDPTRPHMAQICVEHVEGDMQHLRYVTATNAHTLHHARIATWKLPEAMQEPALYDVLRCTQTSVTVRRHPDTDYNPDGTPRWMAWKKVLPPFPTYGQDLKRGNMVYHLNWVDLPRAQTGARIGNLLCTYAIQYGEALNVEYVRNLWIKDRIFKVRGDRGRAVAFRSCEGDEYLHAIIMPLRQE